MRAEHYAAEADYDAYAAGLPASAELTPPGE